MTIKISQFPHRYLFVLFFLGLFFITGAAQTTSPPAVDDLLIFGPPVPGKINTFVFSSKYYVEVKTRTNGEVASIYLYRNERAARFTKLSLGQINKFYRRVRVIRDIGEPVSIAAFGFRYFEDTYQFARVKRFYTRLNDEDSEHLFTSELEVLFPYKIGGVISSVAGEGPGIKIKIGLCEYYNFTEGVRPGDSGEFWVIGPTNDFGTGKCVERRTALGNSSVTKPL